MFLAGLSCNAAQTINCRMPSIHARPSSGCVAQLTWFSCCMQEGEGAQASAEVAGERVPLQGIHLTIPGDHKLSGLTFVMRSEDSSRWWRDGQCRLFTVTRSSMDCQMSVSTAACIIPGLIMHISSKRPDATL